MAGKLGITTQRGNNICRRQLHENSLEIPPARLPHHGTAYAYYAAGAATDYSPARYGNRIHR
jgi:hypothetical protein